MEDYEISAEHSLGRALRNTCCARLAEGRHPLTCPLSAGAAGAARQAVQSGLSGRQTLFIISGPSLANLLCLRFG